MLKKTTRWITHLLNWFCLIAMLGLALIVALQVVSRLLKISLPWTEELARFLLVWLTFLGCVLAIYRKSHLSVNFLVEMMPEKLKRQMALAAQHPEAGLFFTGSAFISEDDHKYGYTLSVPERVNYRRLLGQNVISCSSVLVRRELMERFPMGNDAIHEDFAVWLKILREEPWAYGVNEPLLVYRLSRSSKSGNKLKAARMTFGTYRYIRVPLPLAVWSGILYTVRGIRKFRAIGASLTDEIFALPASGAEMETE